MDARARVTIEPEHLDLHDDPVPGDTAARPGAEFQTTPLRERVLAFQRAAVQDALQRHGGWADAARELGMDRSNLFNLAKRLGVGLERS
jgi:anaerobic nitric oxide reductase transcription regulator